MDRDVEAAAWERARTRRAQEQAARQSRRDRWKRLEDEVAAERSGRRRRELRRNVAIVVGALIAVGVALGFAIWPSTRARDEDPEWLRVLGLNEPVDGSPAESEAPERLGTVGVPPAASNLDEPGPGTSVPARLDAAEPPRIDTTGEDFERIWRQAQLYEGWLLRHPDPALASQIYVEGTPTAQRVVDLLGQLQRDGLKIEVHGYRILGVTVDERPGPDAVILRYADTYTGRDVIDLASGVVREHEDYDGRARLWRLEMRRGGDGRWLAMDIEFLRFGDVASEPG
ncbi:MAG: hypothetical protein WHS89_04655 [Acidimicrobiales bacterium]